MGKPVEIAVSLATLVLVPFPAAASSPEGSAITRPITLPAGTIAPTLLGNYTNWNSGGSSNSGESAALGIDLGVTSNAQIGVAVGLPINPGAAFGSFTFDAMFAVSPVAAVRLDVGMERIGLNGGGLPASDTHATRWFGAAGPYVRLPLAPNVAFVCGRAGVVQFSRFLNLDAGGGTAFYFGATYFPVAAGSDILAISAGDHDSGTVIGINLPLGILVQPHPALALTLRAGYSALIAIPSSGNSVTDHFLPVGLEAVLSPAPQFDIGLNLMLDGYLAETSSRTSVNGPGYFDLRTVLLWFQVRTGG